MMPLEYARLAAADFVGHIAPFCERVEVAGSVRREAERVKDIEVVAIPKVRYSKDLFDNVTDRVNKLAKYVSESYRRVKGGERYIQLEHDYEDIKIDLFMVLPPAQWGVIFAIRTGPWQFSRHIVTQRNRGGKLPSDCYVSKGAVWQGGEQYIDENGDMKWRGGEIVEMPEEIDFFNFLELPWLEPSERSLWIGNV